MSNLKPSVRALLLAHEWASVKDAGRVSAWSKRLALLDRYESTNPVTGDDTIFPADGSHYRVRQLETIWTLLAIQEPVVSDGRHRQRIGEVVENRNAIAHGRETAQDIGRAYSAGDLQDRIDDVDHITDYLLATVEAHCVAGGYMVEDDAAP